YTLFSVAPLLIIAIAIAGLVFGEDAARGQVREQLRETIGADAAGAVQTLLEKTSEPTRGVWATVVGAVALLAGALGVFIQLRTALGVIWRMAPPQGAGLLGVLKDYLLAFLMVLLSGVLLLVSLAASTALAALARAAAGTLPGGSGLWHAVEFLISIGFFTLLFATVFRVLSGNRIAWGDVWNGALVTAVLFTIGKTLIGFYLAYT